MIKSFSIFSLFSKCVSTSNSFILFLIALSSTERKAQLPIGRICWQMQSYFPRERKPTRRVNRSPTSTERRDRVGGVEAAGKVDSTSRILFPCASTMRKCETPSVLEKQLSFVFLLSFSLSLFLNLYLYSLQSYYIKGFFLSLIVIATIYFLLFIDN